MPQFPIATCRSIAISSHLSSGCSFEDEAIALMLGVQSVNQLTKEGFQLKLVQLQESCESETVLSSSATEGDIRSALESLDETEIVMLVADGGTQIQTQQSQETRRYWLNLTEVSHGGKMTLSYIEGQVADLEDVVKAFNYFLTRNPKLGADFTWMDGSDDFQSTSDVGFDEQVSKEDLEGVDPAVIDSYRKTFEADRKRVESMSPFESWKAARTSAREAPASRTKQEEERAAFDAEMAAFYAGQAAHDAEMTRLEKQRPHLDAVSAKVASLDADTLRAEVVTATEHLRKLELAFSHGHLNSLIVCPQCSDKGYVAVRKVSKKAGVSGGKATAALLTGGLSLFVAGLSRKEEMTEAFCANCNSQWYF